MYQNKCSKCGAEFETKNPKRVICPSCLYPDRKPISLKPYEDAIAPKTDDGAQQNLNNPNTAGSTPTEGQGFHNRNAGGYAPRPQQGNYQRPQGQGNFQRPYQQGGNYQQGGGYQQRQGGYQQRGGDYQRQGNYQRPQGQGNFQRPYQQGGNYQQGGGYQQRQNNGYQRPQGQGGFQRPSGGYRPGGRPPAYGRPGGRPPQRGGPRGPKKPLLISKEQVANIEKLYLPLLPLPNPDVHEIIAQQVNEDPKKVFFGINLIRQKLMLPKVQFTKRKIVVSPEQLKAIESLYAPLLPLPPIGCHKFISKQLKMDEWRVHVGIGIIRKQMELPRWNPDREDAPEEFKLQRQAELAAQQDAPKQDEPIKEE